MFPALRIVTALIVMSTASTAPASSGQTVVRQALPDVSSTYATAALNETGRLVAFESMAQLLPVDTNQVVDIYVLDRVARTLTLETVTPAGTASNGDSSRPQLSGDGRYVVFDSTATNLTPLPDRNEMADVFVRDRLTGATRRLSVGIEGQEANAPSGPSVISQDGAVVAFASSATNLVHGADTNSLAADIYLVQRATGDIARVGIDSAGRQFDVSQSPDLDGAGRVVVFAARERTAPPAARGASSRKGDLAVYARDLSSGVTTCLSCAGKSAAVGLPAFLPDISSDGRMVAFAVQSDPARSDVVVHDRVLSTATLITRHANARSAAPRISGNGTVVVFVSWASNLLCKDRCASGDIDENLLPDVYLFDSRTGRFSRVSGSGETWWTPSLAAVIAADGTTIVFSSRQPFGPEDETVDFDLFLMKRPSGTLEP